MVYKKICHLWFTMKFAIIGLQRNLPLLIYNKICCFYFTKEFVIFDLKCSSIAINSCSIEPIFRNLIDVIGENCGFNHVIKVDTIISAVITKADFMIQRGFFPIKIF